MARWIPALPYSAPEPTLGMSGLPIHAGSPGLAGHLWDLAGAINLGLATGRAQPVIPQGWADGQFTLNLGVFTEICRWRIPELSPYHVELACRAYADTAGVSGTLRWKSVNAAGQVDVVVAGPLGWFDSPGGGHLPVSFVGGWEEIILEVKDDILVKAVNCTYLDYDPSAAWPGADGAIAAGRTGTLVPIDSAEVSPDEPLSSDLGEVIRDNLVHLEARPRVYFNWSTLADSTLGAQVMGAVPHRQYIPVEHHTEAKGRELTIHVRAANPSGSNAHLYIQHGRGARSELVRLAGNPLALLEPELGHSVSRVTFAALAALGWKTITIQMPEVRTLDVPPEYGGFTHLAFYPDDFLEVHTVSVWGR